jgi:hypothetical protein
VLPASRQPMPMAPEVQAELAKRGRSARQIESDIVARTERLSANIDELTARLTPSRLEVLGAVAGAALVVGLLLWRARRH